MLNNRLKTLYFILLTFLLSFSCEADQLMMKDYIGQWKGEFPDNNDFDLELIIKESDNQNSIFTISANENTIITKDFLLKNPIEVNLSDDVLFQGIIDEENSEIGGIITSNGYIYPARLKKKVNEYVGTWRLSAFKHLRPETLDLVVKSGNGPNDQYTAYPILGTLWCNNFIKDKEKISFADSFTGLRFNGVLQNSEIVLDASLGGNKITQIVYKKITGDHKKVSSTNPVDAGEWKYSSEPLLLTKLEEDVLNNSLTGTEGVVIAKSGKIIYEKYFNGFNSDIPHDTRSASKSIYSAIVGIAIDEGIIESVDGEFFQYVPEKFKYTSDQSKSKIKLEQLLNMSSGIGVSEGKYQQSGTWLQTVLEPKLKHEPGTVSSYKSADPYLLGIYLSERLESPLALYVVNKLLNPLGIDNFIINTDDTKKLPYFGGGLHLTPRDMLKFGQLYLNKGKWNGKQIISEEWVEKSFFKHTRLENVSDKNEYGYFWWHNDYMINNRQIKSVEARGAGGQYIFVIPELDSVVVITSGNYRNGKTRQPEKILKNYILPAILK